MLYSELQCSPAIHQAVERMGFAEMTEIQEKNRCPEQQPYMQSRKCHWLTVNFHLHQAQQQNI